MKQINIKFTFNLTKTCYMYFKNYSQFTSRVTSFYIRKPRFKVFLKQPIMPFLKVTFATICSNDTNYLIIGNFDFIKSLFQPIKKQVRYSNQIIYSNRLLSLLLIKVTKKKCILIIFRLYCIFAEHLCVRIDKISNKISIQLH